MKGFLKNLKNQTKEMCEGPQIKHSKQYGEVSGKKKKKIKQRKPEGKISENSTNQTENVIGRFLKIP